MAIRIPESLTPITNFATQVVVGSVAFAVVFLAAAGLAWLISATAEATGAPRWLHDSAGYVEIGIWGADVFVLALFVLSEVIKSVRAFWIESRRSHE